MNEGRFTPELSCQHHHKTLHYAVRLHWDVGCWATSVRQHGVAYISIYES